MGQSESESRIQQIAELLGDFGVDLSDAICNLYDITDKYEEGWEDKTLDCAIRLTLSLQNLLEQLGIITGEKWVNLEEMDLVNTP